LVTYRHIPALNCRVRPTKDTAGYKDGEEM